MLIYFNYAFIKFTLLSHRDLQVFNYSLWLAHSLLSVIALLLESLVVLSMHAVDNQSSS